MTSDAVLELSGLGKDYGDRTAVKSVDLVVRRGEIFGLRGPYNALLVRHGTGFADVIKPIAAVYGFAAVFMFVGIRRFRFDA